MSNSNIPIPLSSNDLPLTIIFLEEWTLITINGIDSIKYLQGQLTCNIVSLNSNQYIFAAHCNAQGKMYSTIRIFYHLDQLSLIIRSSVRDRQLEILKKYAVFSKVTITANDNVVLLGIAGFQAQETLNQFFARLPNILCPVIHYTDTTIIYFSQPKHRFLLITTHVVRNYLLHVLTGKAQINNSKQWLALDIEAGYPIIDDVTSTRLIPQAVNLELLGGIDFNKGCYVGQEVIARTKYRGMNKQKLYFLIGNASNIPVTGESLEIKIGNHWRCTGIILAACQMANQKIWVQAVLNNDLEIDSLLRVREDNNSLLNIYPLFYKTL
ncbi:tRNA-modifying protein YgfZ [Candidatus Palibaumannia cicadellinicola]|nr:tRNA-modifying protein YgfZ [Candidatus Baumannia cicadellinicola]